MGRFTLEVQAEKEARENKRGLWSDVKAEAKDKGKQTLKADEKATVYVTKTGTKYHAEGCRFLTQVEGRDDARRGEEARLHRPAQYAGPRSEPRRAPGSGGSGLSGRRTVWE